MPNGYTVDFSEVDQLAADLGTVAATAGSFIRSAVTVTARRVKDDADAKVREGSASWAKPLGSAIDYELKTLQAFGASVVDAEVGYNRTRYGDRAKLGNLREFGAPGADGVPLAPHNDLQRALEANQEDFEYGLSEALKDAEAVLHGDSGVIAGAAAVIRGRYR